MSLNRDSVHALLADLDTTREQREELYIHFHRHPELSMQEFGTADRIRTELEAAGIDVRAVGRTGLVAVIANEDGPTVAMRADIDAPLL